MTSWCSCEECEECGCGLPQDHHGEGWDDEDEEWP
jgi:hypothetical protein